MGKSTLLNAFLKEKVAIVSPKPETTRDRLLGILTLNEAQLLFLDTPGIYRGAKTLLAKHQIKQAIAALGEADLILLMTEGPAGLTEGDCQIIELLRRREPSDQKVPGTHVPLVFLAINKVDRVEKGLILPQIEEAQRLFSFREIFPTSATKGDNLPALLKALVEALPEGPALYPPDQVTDKSVRSLAQEIVREKALLFTHEEVPYVVAVAIEEWRPGEKSQRPGGEGRPSTYIRATLYVERESQKGILIGKGGALLKRIGQAAREEIEKLVEGAVFLDLWVKVAKNWRSDPTWLRRLGYG